MTDTPMQKIMDRAVQQPTCRKCNRKAKPSPRQPPAMPYKVANWISTLRMTAEGMPDQHRSGWYCDDCAP